MSKVILNSALASMRASGHWRASLHLLMTSSKRGAKGTSKSTFMSEKGPLWAEVAGWLPTCSLSLKLGSNGPLIKEWQNRPCWCTMKGSCPYGGWCEVAAWCLPPVPHPFLIHKGESPWIALSCVWRRISSMPLKGGAECSLKQIRILPWLPTKGEVRGQGQWQSHGGYHQF